ncbi:phosphoserine phosphatase SerB [Sphingomonas sp. So64.6b]|uniref:phosphoserine phosphatase SerB n=1 Tax=Sphingomonas sp. So64.6b TaxID=2997354 RepID=UPI00160127AF|nr:phosphoserine phosphatase SerB [Sphingomonas sp. So64.6b]QNA84149.1 phosphoserine phosphatase SerB [Sphingomonas sp. So64.6b]
MFIATLIAPGTLAGSDISAASDALRDAGCAPGGNQWLDEGFAADILFDAEPELARETLEMACPAIDIVVQPLAGRAKALLIADMDSTMITVECIDELADYAGIKPQIAEITERAMRGELDFEAALDARVALLKGLDEAVIEQCLAERVAIMPGAVPLIRTMRARGALTILVSGGFTRFAQPVAKIIGFDRAIANVLEVADGMLTGTVTKPIVGSDTKLQTLLNASAEMGLKAEQTLAVGDGANDLAMIKRAGLGIAYRAKPIVAAAAAARIGHNDLTALLYAQGIAKADWVSA